ncbi:hypothetical protein [Bifidobacterium sp. A11]|uniref:hypothetical protein n=1 Tax=Bifidobacterium sp. A11 TaxID=1394176 RepID=UPI00155AE0AF|nr:hypothetical protein [Bifidobacterium sp. A11]
MPADDDLYLIGLSLFVFNRLYQFMIELLGYDTAVTKTWHELMDMPLKGITDNLCSFICRIYGIDEEEDKQHVNAVFDELVERRNRIVHEFIVTDETGQALRTKTKHNFPDPEKQNQQFPVTRGFMQDFISDTKDMEYKLNNFREYLWGNHLI